MSLASSDELDLLNSGLLSNSAKWSCRFANQKRVQRHASNANLAMHLVNILLFTLLVRPRGAVYLLAKGPKPTGEDAKCSLRGAHCCLHAEPFAPITLSLRTHKGHALHVLGYWVR